MNQYSPPVEAAIALARRAHAGQTDKAGAPYIGHPLRIMAKMASDDERIAAILHDVVEDSRDSVTPVTFADLAALGLPEPAIDAVRLLTRTDDGTDPAAYEAYIDAILANPIARKVKLADVEDNLDVTRLAVITERDEKRLAKYRRVRARLLGVE
jgi:HD domain